MKIGVLSDSHDNLTNVRRAVEIFLEYGVEALIHGGDFCSPFVFVEFSRFKERGIRMHAVFGNNDGDKVLLARRGEGFCEFRDGVSKLDLGGRRILLMHYPDIADDLFTAGIFDLVIYGHNHTARIEGTEKKLINPGTCSGYLAEKASVALVDTAALQAQIVYF